MSQRHLKALFLAVLTWAKRTGALFHIFSILFNNKHPHPNPDPDLAKPAAPSHFNPPPTMYPYPHSSSSQAPRSEAPPYIACSNVPKSAQNQNATQSPTQSPTQSKRKTRPLPPSRRTQTPVASMDSASFSTSPPVSPILRSIQINSPVHIRRRPTPPRPGLITNGKGNGTGNGGGGGNTHSSLIRGHGHGANQNNLSQTRPQTQTHNQIPILDCSLSGLVDAYASVILDPDGLPISIYTDEPNEIEGEMPMSSIVEAEAEASQHERYRGVVGREGAMTLMPGPGVKARMGPRPMPMRDVSDVLADPQSSSPTQIQDLDEQAIGVWQQRDSSEGSPGASGTTRGIGLEDAGGDAGAQSQSANSISSADIGQGILHCQEVASPAHIVHKAMGTFQPSNSSRYDGNLTIKDNAGPWTFPPLVSLTINDDDNVHPWIRYTQPEGQPYFVNPSRSRGICFVTEANMFDTKTREEVDRFVVRFEERYEAFKAKFYERLERRRMPGHSRENSGVGPTSVNPALSVGSNVQSQPQSHAQSPSQVQGSGEKEEENDDDPTLTISTLPTNIEVVLQINNGEWKYYMVDLDRRMIFWIDPHDADETVFPPHFGVEFREHFRNNFIGQFWTHVEIFPCHRMLVTGVLDEIMGILGHMHIDLTTSKTSTACFNRDELNDLMSSARHLKKLEHSMEARQYVVCGCARLMILIYYERFINFWGFPGARLSNNQSVRGAHPRSFSPTITIKRGFLFRILCPVLFFAPEYFMRKIEDIYVDKLIKVRPWRKFIQRMEDSFAEYILYSTVLLNANVAYLSIPTVQSDQLLPDFWMGAGSVVSTCSMIMSLGSIIIGLLLVRQQRAGGQYAEEAVEYIQSRSHPTRGAEMLAILYSLPYALLLWGMTLFFGSVALTCFTVSGNINTHLTRAVYGVLWGAVLSLILATVVNAGEGGLKGFVDVFTQKNFIILGVKKLTMMKLKVHWPSTDGKDGCGPRIPRRGGAGGILRTDLDDAGDVGKKRRPSLSLRVRSIFPSFALSIVSPSPTDETLAAPDQDGDFLATPSSSPLTTLHPSSITRAQYAETRPIRSVRSSHSRLTTNTAVDSSRAKAVRHAVRKATGEAKRKLTMLVPRYTTSLTAAPSGSNGSAMTATPNDETRRGYLDV